MNVSSSTSFYDTFFSTTLHAEERASSPLIIKITKGRQLTAMMQSSVQVAPYAQSLRQLHFPSAALLSLVKQAASFPPLHAVLQGNGGEACPCVCRCVCVCVWERSGRVKPDIGSWVVMQEEGRLLWNLQWHTWRTPAGSVDIVNKNLKVLIGAYIFAFGAG